MTSISMHDGRVVLHQADCLAAMAAMEENSVDAVVCDPPYHLTSIVNRFGKDGSAPAKEGTDGAFQRASGGFMGKVWDGGDIAFQPETWAAVLRVLKPGGYIVAFASTRGFGRMSVAMEDAGFITHPMLAWIFGSGFPKATRIAADGYDGFRYGGQALKPALEPIYMGQKPFSEKTGTANILKWGTGAINVDGCRVGSEERTYAPKGTTTNAGMIRVAEDKVGTAGEEVTVLGRWPANICHDGSDEVLAAFPDAPGQQRAVGPEHGEKESRGIYGDFGAREHFAPRIEIDKSAARFFYCAKASRADRDAGLEGFEKKSVLGYEIDPDRPYASGKMNNSNIHQLAMAMTGKPPSQRANTHPTVKPVSLCQWLCRLVTPPGGTILDPFMGSGSTGKGAILEGFKFVGIEREDEYMPIATARIQWAVEEVNRPLKASATKVKAPANDNDSGDLFSFGHAASSTEAA